MSKHKGQAIPVTPRTMIGLLGVGAAALFGVTFWFDLTREELLQFLMGTLIFVAGVVLLAAVMVAVLKLPGILRRTVKLNRQKPDDRNDAN